MPTQAKQEIKEINLSPKQSEAWDIFEDDTTTELGYGGAAYGGKTRLGAYLADFIAHKYPGSIAGIGRKELKNLIRTTVAELFIVFGELGYKEGLDYKYNQQYGEISFPNGSKIYLFDTAYSPKDPLYLRFGSYNLTWFWCDEANETEYDAIKILRTRVGRNNTFIIDGKSVELKPFTLLTFNPDKGHVYRDFYLPDKEHRLPPFRRFVKALPTDNPHATVAYLNQLRNSDPITIQRLLYGNFEYDNDPLALMGFDAIMDLFSNTVEPSDLQTLIADIARFGKDKICIGRFKGSKLVGLYLYKYLGTDETAKILKDLAARFKIPFSHILADEDGVGGGVMDQMRGIKGFIGNSTPFPVLDTRSGKMVASNYVNLRSQCFFELSEIVNVHNLSIDIEDFETNIEGMTVEKAKLEIAEELQQVKQKDPDKEGKKAIIGKDKMKEALGRSPDYADMLSMKNYFNFEPLPGMRELKREGAKYLNLNSNNRTHQVRINKSYE